MAGEDVDDAWREAGLVYEVGDAGWGQRGFLAGFENDSTSRGHCRGDLHCEGEGGDVPLRIGCKQRLAASAWIAELTGMIAATGPIGCLKVMFT